MVKKTYVAPSVKEARTKLRTGLLAGSTMSGIVVDNGNGVTIGGGREDNTTPSGGTISESKARMSLD